jgi:hypothetical protein
MLFVDYNFHLLPDGSIQWDPELTPSKLEVKEGDEFVVSINDNNLVYFRKKHDTIHTSTD